MKIFDACSEKLCYLFLRYAWVKWKEGQDQKKTVAHMDSMALQFWAYRMQLQVSVHVLTAENYKFAQESLTYCVLPSLS
jgi:hypothetical protein